MVTRKKNKYAYLFVVMVFCISLTYADAATFKATPFSVTGAYSGKKITIDKGFESRHGMAVPAPFSFVVPRLADVKVYAEYPKGHGDAYVKLSFADGNRNLIENLRFVPMQVAMASLQARMQGAANLLVQKGFPMAVKGYRDAKILSQQAVRIGSNNAVQVTGQYVDPAIGRVYLRLVAILNPKSRHCLLAFANAVQGNSLVKKARDIGSKGITVAVIQSVRYL